MKFREYWLSFLRWRGWQVCADGWRAFLRWKGWSAIAGWKLWRPHPLLLLGLTALSGLGLFWVFSGHREQHPVSYFVYVLSAYTLTALVLTVPKLVRRSRVFIQAHPRLAAALKDKELRFRLELYREQFINFGYGIFKIVSGVVVGSAWIGADGIYNTVQGVIQLFQILQRRRNLDPEKQWKSYRVCGWLILLLHLTMTGPVFQMVNLGRAEDHPGYMIFATAAFAFYKLISSFVDVAKDRKHKAPVDSSVRLLELTQALFAIFSLQVSMFHTFGADFAQKQLMNMLTGCVVCLLVVSTGVYMIRRANRALKNKI